MDQQTGLKLFRDVENNQMVRRTKNFFKRYVYPHMNVAVVAAVPKKRSFYCRYGKSEELFEMDKQGIIKGNRVFGESIEFDPPKLPFPDDSIEVMIYWNLLGHVKQPLDLFLDAQRVLALNGRLFVKDVNVTHPGVMLYQSIKSLGNIFGSIDEQGSAEWYAYNLNRRGEISKVMHEMGYISHGVRLVEDNQAKAFFKRSLAWLRRNTVGDQTHSKTMQWARPTIIARCRKGQ